MVMAGSTSNGYDTGRSSDGFLNVPNGEAIAEWRSCDHVDNGTPSTSPPYWDTDDVTDGGLKPSELYGRYTWKIEKFSQTSKKELKSSMFEVNNYKWYILIYPQGCDVCNHLSLFLCVADHDKLFPGWGHFAQFTIAVVNKEPKKSKYSDTLHRFWKKEHDWGWKKFMELSKVQDGFINEDTLEIRAQVQIIREQLHRPFRCLDRQYRRELVRVYISNVEQVCLRFLEEQKAKLLKLIEDKVGWTSFCTFWLKTDQDSKQCMSKEKTDAIFRVIVKHFFVEKEVTSTLVMDSLYCGLKALEIESKCTKGKGKLSESEDAFSSLVYVDGNMFILADDILCLLQKASLESLLPKDEKGLPKRAKGPQDRKKDGISGEDLSKDSFERDERRLMELGRRTIEIFVLAHIFSHKIEAAFKEEVALKRQNELIREEEAASKAEIEQKARRQAAEREKRLRRKMRRNNRKCKDRGKDEQNGVAVTCDPGEDNPVDRTIEHNSGMLAESLHEKPNESGDVSDLSDIEGEAEESSLAYVDDRDASCINGDSDSTEACSPRSELSLENGHERKSLSFADEDSSRASTESAQSEELNVLSKREPNGRSQTPPTREEKEGTNGTCEPSKQSVENDIQQSDVAIDARRPYKDSKCSTSTTQGLKAWSCKRDYGQWVEKHTIKKKELPTKLQIDVGNEAKQMMAAETSHPREYPNNSISQLKLSPNDSVREESSANLCQAKTEALPMKQLAQNSSSSKHHVEKATTSRPMSKLTENCALNQVLDPKSNGRLIISNGPAIYGVHSALPTSSLCLEKQLDSEQPSATRWGGENSVSASTVMGLPISRSSSREAANASPMHSASSPFVRLLDNSVNDLLSGVTFGSVTQEVLRNGNQFPEASLQSQSALSRSTESLDSCDPGRVYSTDTVSASLFGQPQRASLDEFPHLDIINYLFDEDLDISTAVNGNEIPGSLGEYNLIHQVSFPDDLGLFELPSVSYDAEAQQVYGSFGSPMNGMADVLSVYGNGGHLDGMIQNWPISYGSSVGPVGEGYPYQVPDYSNLACSISGYPVFQLSHGH